MTKTQLEKRLFPEYLTTESGRAIIYNAEPFNGVWSATGLGYHNPYSLIGNDDPKTYFLK